MAKFKVLGKEYEYHKWYKGIVRVRFSEERIKEYKKSSEYLIISLPEDFDKNAYSDWDCAFYLTPKWIAIQTRASGHLPDGTTSSCSFGVILDLNKVKFTSKLIEIIGLDDDNLYKKGRISKFEDRFIKPFKKEYRRLKNHFLGIAKIMLLAEELGYDIREEFNTPFGRVDIAVLKKDKIIALFEVETPQFSSKNLIAYDLQLLGKNCRKEAYYGFSRKITFKKSYGKLVKIRKKYVKAIISSVIANKLTATELKKILHLKPTTKIRAIISETKGKPDISWLKMRYQPAKIRRRMKVAMICPKCKKGFVFEMDKDDLLFEYVDTKCPNCHKFIALKKEKFYGKLLRRLNKR